MKKTLALASVSACCAAMSLLCGGLAGVCSGWIGESKEQLVERYGEPETDETDRTKIHNAIEWDFDRQLSFLHNNMKIIVTTQKGKSVAEEFIFLRGQNPSPITDEMLGSVEALLESSSNGQKWLRAPPGTPLPGGITYFWLCKGSTTIAYVAELSPNILNVEATLKKPQKK